MVDFIANICVQRHISMQHDDIIPLVLIKDWITGSLPGMKEWVSQIRVALCWGSFSVGDEILLMHVTHLAANSLAKRFSVGDKSWWQQQCGLTWWVLTCIIKTDKRIEHDLRAWPEKLIGKECSNMYYYYKAKIMTFPFNQVYFSVETSSSSSCLIIKFVMKHKALSISYLFWELIVLPEAQKDVVLSCTLLFEIVIQWEMKPSCCM